MSVLSGFLLHNKIHASEFFFSWFCLHFLSPVSKRKFGLLFFKPVDPESEKVRLGNEMCKMKHPIFIKELET